MIYSLLMLIFLPILMYYYIKL